MQARCTCISSARSRPSQVGDLLGPFGHSDCKSPKSSRKPHGGMNRVVGPKSVSPQIPQLCRTARLWDSVSSANGASPNQPGATPWVLNRKYQRAENLVHPRSVCHRLAQNDHGRSRREAALSSERLNSVRADSRPLLRDFGKCLAPRRRLHVPMAWFLPLDSAWVHA